MAGSPAKKAMNVVLPYDILEAIMTQIVGQDLRAGCRLATTCKQLWTLQLPSSVYRHMIHNHFSKEKTSMQFDLESERGCMGSADSFEP